MAKPLTNVVPAPGRTKLSGSGLAARRTAQPLLPVVGHTGVPSAPPMKGATPAPGGPSGSAQPLPTFAGQFVSNRTVMRSRTKRGPQSLTAAEPPERASMAASHAVCASVRSAGVLAKQMPVPVRSSVVRLSMARLAATRSDI